jgi:hypothetical protein
MLTFNHGSNKEKCPDITTVQTKAIFKYNHYSNKYNIKI